MSVCVDFLLVWNVMIPVCDDFPLVRAALIQVRGTLMPDPDGVKPRGGVEETQYAIYSESGSINHFPAFQ